jgi:hypothetical protein
LFCSREEDFSLINIPFIFPVEKLLITLLITLFYKWMKMAAGVIHISLTGHPAFFNNHFYP